MLQWFSGNIGFLHIHHLSPRIGPMFHEVKPITLFSSLKSLSLRLWDEKLRRLLGYRHMRKVRKERAAASGHDPRS